MVLPAGAAAFTEPGQRPVILSAVVFYQVVVAGWLLAVLLTVILYRQPHNTSTQAKCTSDSSLC